MKLTFILIFFLALFGITHGRCVHKDNEERRGFFTDMIDRGKTKIVDGVGYVKELIEVPKNYFYGKEKTAMQNIYGKPIVQEIIGDVVTYPEVETFTTANGTQIYYIIPREKKKRGKKQKKPNGGGAANNEDKNDPNAGPPVNVLDGLDTDDGDVPDDMEAEAGPEEGPPVDVMDGLDTDDGDVPDDMEAEAGPEEGPPVDVMDGLDTDDVDVPDDMEAEAGPEEGPPVNVLDGLDTDDGVVPDDMEAEAPPEERPPVDVMDGLDTDDGDVPDDIVDEGGPEGRPPVDVMDELNSEEADPVEEIEPEAEFNVPNGAFDVLQELDSEEELTRRYFQQHMFSAERLDDDHVKIDGKIFDLSEIMVPVSSPDTKRSIYAKYGGFDGSEEFYSAEEEARRYFEQHMFSAERLDEDHVKIDGEIFNLSDMMVPVSSSDTRRSIYAKYGGFDGSEELYSAEEEARRYFEQLVLSAERLDDDHVKIDGQIFNLSDIVEPDTRRSIYVKYVYGLRY